MATKKISKKRGGSKQGTAKETRIFQRDGHKSLARLIIAPHTRRAKSVRVSPNLVILEKSRFIYMRINSGMPDS